MLPYTVFWIKSNDFKQYPKLKIQGSAAGRGVTPDVKSFGAEKNFNDLAGFVDAVRVSSFVDSVRLRQRIARDPNQAVPLVLGHLMRRQKSTWMLMLGPFAWEKAWLCKGVPDWLSTTLPYGMKQWGLLFRTCCRSLRGLLLGWLVAALERCLLAFDNLLGLLHRTLLPLCALHMVILGFACWLLDIWCSEETAETNVIMGSQSLTKSTPSDNQWGLALQELCG